MSAPFAFADFYNFLQQRGLSGLQQQFSAGITAALQRPDGNLPRWLAALQKIPEVQARRVQLDCEAITAVADDDEASAEIEAGLLGLSPWRKGPFRLGGILIDSEWRSWMKWERVAPHLASLRGRLILDVGCGNGYYLFRMAGSGAEAVIGIDPSLLFLAQFTAVQRFVGQKNVFMLPIGFEEMPADLEVFDTVFSMGVFYHRRSPFDFLKSLKMLLRSGGELVLETLVIEGDHRQVLVPPGRYARMSNIWFIPSVEAMLLWLEKAGFSDARAVDLCPTTTDEQRSTRWMPGESFDCCLAGDNPALTIEGLPAPLRAVFIARRP